MNANGTRYLSLSDVADLLRLPMRRIARWVRQGTIPAIVLPDGELVFDADEIAAWIDARREGVRP
jgi:predicted site-specific integrase-resolvase